MPNLFTIGYEGAAQSSILEALLHHDVETLVDIRELPQSRKPGFSKTALATAVTGHGMKYMHMRALGTPRDIRHQRRIDHDQDAFREAFLQYLATQDEAIQDLAERVNRETCCLMCFEADARLCHRWFVAEAVVRKSGDAMAIVHLSAEPVHHEETL
jgi:uncharacterized protein (DUF488 family)